MNAAKF